MLRLSAKIANKFESNNIQISSETGKLEGSKSCTRKGPIVVPWCMYAYMYVCMYVVYIVCMHEVSVIYMCIFVPTEYLPAE